MNGEHLKSQHDHERPNIEHMFGKRFQSKAKMLSTQLHSIAISHYENGYITLGGIKLHGSNYIDLIRYLIYKSRVPQHWDVIEDYLVNKKLS